MKPLDLSPYKRIVFLTGAGISVASGLRPYRGPGGLWETEDEEVILATREGLDVRPADAWKMFARLRKMAGSAEPNPAHLAIAKLQARLGPDRSLTVITQNVDGLHQRAGTQNVVELHGSIFRTRCNNDRCMSSPFEDREPPADELPLCPSCGDLLRPDVVLFDEYIPVNAERSSKHALNECDLFIAVGTSGTVAPASSFVRSAAYAGARTYVINLEPMAIPNPAFEKQILGRAEELLPILLSSTSAQPI